MVMVEPSATKVTEVVPATRVAMVVTSVGTSASKRLSVTKRVVSRTPLIVRPTKEGASSVNWPASLVVGPDFGAQAATASAAARSVSLNFISVIL